MLIAVARDDGLSVSGTSAAANCMENTIISNNHPNSRKVVLQCLSMGEGLWEHFGGYYSSFPSISRYTYSDIKLELEVVKKLYKALFVFSLCSFIFVILKHEAFDYCNYM